MELDGSKIQVAPGRLRLVQEFINTNDLLTQTEELASPGHLHRWLDNHNLLGTDEPVSEANLQQALIMRKSLHAMLITNNGATLNAEAIAMLNSIAHTYHLWVRFSSDGQAQLEPSTSGVDGALSQLLAIIYSTMVDGTWMRLKACHNSECHYVFYDYSKNRSAIWCTMAICGNRLKTRTYRQRRRASEQPE